jgi:hypothetical protein
VGASVCAAAYEAEHHLEHKDYAGGNASTATGTAVDTQELWHIALWLNSYLSSYV